jgi:hypothetical protein
MNRESGANARSGSRHFRLAIENVIPLRGGLPQSPKVMGLRTNIINLLASAAPARTDFTLFGSRILGRDYGTIATAIRNGHIQIVQSATMPSTLAAYNRALNCFTVGANPSDSLLVHEATHAINDWHGRSLRGTDDEGLAYVAQMVYLCRLNPAMRAAALSDTTRERTDQSLMMCGSSSRLCSQSTIGYATIIAATLMEGRAPAPELLQSFQRALAADPNTVAPAARRVYNRITRVEVPADYLRQVAGRVVTD